VASAITGTGGLVKAGSGTMALTGANTYSGGTTVSGGVLMGTTSSLQGNILNNATVAFSQSGSGTYAGNMSGSGALVLQDGGLTLGGTNSYTGGTTVNGGILQGTTTSLQGNIANNSAVVFNQASTGTYAGVMSGGGVLGVTGGGTLTLTGANSYTGGTLVMAGTLQGTTTSLQGDITNNATVAFNQTGAGTYAGAMSGSGALVVSGGGTVILTGANSYTGGTTMSSGTLQGSSSSLQGNILNNASLVFSQSGTGTYAGVISGAGSMTLQGGGTLSLTSDNTYTGPTTVNASTLIVNGSLASSVTLSNGGMLKGNGTVGGVVANGGVLAPGNSIGTLNVNGNFTQNGGVYQVEANAAGQSDKINVAGTAAINGGTVQVLAQPGTYSRNTTYTIVNAVGGVSGAYSNVTSNFAFLTPSLSYNANNVFLTLAMTQSAFASGAQTGNQFAVGQALDQANNTATGDFNTVLNAMAVLSTTQGPAALTAISGQPYADFGTMNVNNSALFMNALGQQMASARGAASAGQRQALAQACEIESCDGAGPLSAWASALGGLGSVLGDSNASTLTYNLGGAAAGIDYRLDPRFLVGIGTGYTHGTQWVNSFMGQGWSDSVSVAAYGSFMQAGFYADALAGYAYSNNQLQRQILIPGLQQRTATGSTGANQFLGQAETGYKVDVYAPAQASITPFGRLQISSVTQNAFSESGAQSLSLNVAQQTTNSLRTTIGADLAGAIVLGNERKLDLAVRFGWQHEFADTGRPITAAFAGAPGNSFTVFGATPARDSAVVGFQATTTIAEATQVYLRYDGGVGGGTDNHALNVGVRFTW
jgi:autotransporter-associated beta strand protein